MKVFEIGEHTINTKEILERIEYKESDIIFLSGSLIEGIGNSKSDLDVFILTDSFNSYRETEYEKKHRKTEFFLINELQCDVEIWDITAIYSILQQLDSINLSDTKLRTANSLNYENINIESIFSFFHRFIMGQPLINFKGFNDLLNSLNKDNYFTLLNRWNVNIIDLMYEDIVGNMKKGEYETAYIILNTAMIKSLLSYLSYKGVSTDRDKWAYINMKNLSIIDPETKTILEEFQKLFFEREDFQKIEENCKKRIKFINKLIRKYKL
ncbi:nucleotidyltransferase domain-containing protein [Psychrobacillus sp. PGGUH221]|uniref:nucleotidyltransferase domain-containing protein n=1 Tax=Psychrobacillus sp. PGGUH221 TaxID=3020058 RepID=UPI0035C69701